MRPRQARTVLAIGLAMVRRWGKAMTPSAFRSQRLHPAEPARSLSSRPHNPVLMPWSSGSITLLLAVGALVVISQPRPRAIGLAQVLLAADLLQSFPIEGHRPVPELWKQRLGLEAPSLWRRSSGSWWQLWSGHDDAGAALVIPAATFQGSQRPTQALTVDDLVVISPGPLATSELATLLSPKQRQLQGLEQRCLARLQQGQAVYWSGQGLAGIFGSLTPLLQHWQQGCLSLEISAESLRWNGEAAAVPGLQAEAPPALAADSKGKALPPETALVLIGTRLDLLLGGLLRRSLVRDSLQQTYGLDPDTLSAMAASPFALSLRSLPEGPFRLGLALEVNPGGRRQIWQRGLRQLEQGIRTQGLQAMAPSPTIPAPGQQEQASVSWKRADGTIVGGWRWYGAAQPAHEGSRSRLVLFLGPPPPTTAIASAPELGQPQSGRLDVVMRPDQLAAVEAMPGSLPPILTTAMSLQMSSAGQGSGGQAGTISPLRGELRLKP